MTLPRPIALARAPVLRGGGRPALVLFALGALSGAVTAFGFVSAPERTFHAYLAAHAFVLSMVLGCIAFIMISHAASATWPVAVRRMPEAMAATMPWLALLFLPLLLGLRELYPWTRPDDYPEPIRHVLAHRAAFMNPTAFGVRSAVYLALWSLLGFLLHRWSLAMDSGADPERFARRLRRLSYAGLPLGGLTAGFAAYDWYMSLSPEFASTMFSALWIAMCLHAGVATTLLLVHFAQRGEASHAAGASHAYALGRLLFAFLIFLGYTAFFQYMLVWMANRPSEAAWYLERASPEYRWLGQFLILGEFALPFFVLLSYRIKRSTRSLAPIALYCLAALYLHVNWLITPSSRAAGLSWRDAVALAAVLSLTLGVALVRQRGQALVAVADPRYPDSLFYESH